MSDELTEMKSPASSDQAQLIRNTDQCLANSLALATNESQERVVKMTREIERLLNDHDATYAHTMTSLEKNLDAEADLMMRKLDEIWSVSNRENLPLQWRTGNKRLTVMEPTVMQGPNQDQEPVLSLTIEKDQRQPRRGRFGPVWSRQKRLRHRGQVYRQGRKSDQYQM